MCYDSRHSGKEESLPRPQATRMNRPAATQSRLRACQRLSPQCRPSLTMASKAWLSALPTAISTPSVASRPWPQIATLPRWSFARCDVDPDLAICNQWRHLTLRNVGQAYRSIKRTLAFCLDPGYDLSNFTEHAAAKVQIRTHPMNLEL